MSVRRSRIPALTVLIALVAIALLFERARQVLARQTRPYATFTAQQVLDRAAPLCRAIAPEAIDLRVSADHSREIAPLQFWSAVGTDTAGRDIVWLGWNADTNELCFVGHELHALHNGKLPSLSRDQAILAAWQWMRVLGFAQRVSRWRLASPPKRCGTWGGAWLVRWRAGDRAVSIIVGTHAGELRVAQSWRLPRRGGSDAPGE